MANRLREKEWRSFEILVARLEATLHGAGVTVRSPDHLLDKDTGSMREVDCTLHDAASDSITSLECRKRKKKQDVLWIEQLVTKRGALGVARTVAVSSVGFSRTAKAKADAHGIVLKTFTEAISESVLGQFRDELQLLHLQQVAKIVDLKIGIDDEGWEPPLDLLHEFQQRLEREQGSAALLLDANKSLITVQQLLDYGLARIGSLPPGRHRKAFQLSLEPKTFGLANREPVAFVSSVIITMDVDVTRKPIRDVRLHQYAARDKVEVELATIQVATEHLGPVKLEIAFKRLP